MRQACNAVKSGRFERAAGASQDAQQRQPQFRRKTSEILASPLPPRTVSTRTAPTQTARSLTALLYRGYRPGPTSVMPHPGRVVETSERQPCVVGVVVVVTVVIVVSVSSRVLHSDTSLSAEHTWRGVRTTHSVMTTLTTQLGSLCNWHIHHLTNVPGFSILRRFLHLLNHQHLSFSHSRRERNFTCLGHATLSHSPATPTHSLHGSSHV